MGNIGTALGAAVTVTIEGDITRADLGDALITIATELGRALANDDVDELFAEALADLAERSKSGVARHAAAVLLGRKGERPRIDVEMAVDEAVDMYRSGRAKSLNAAFVKVSRTMTDVSNRRSAAELLRRRHRDRKISPSN
jgi:hypothetical protein